MDYFFILGNHPELSSAELKARLSMAKNGRFFAKDALVLSLEQELDLPAFLETVGGTIKAGRIVKVFKHTNDPAAGAVEVLNKIAPQGTKLSFGISSYGKGVPNPRKIGMVIKSKLREAGISCRWVTSRESALSSVVVEQNKLLSASGRELVYLGNGQELILGETLAVQPFKKLSQRDFGRPSRDDYSGMLPPKLAQMMINLSRGLHDEILLDPFCGSGTIITEAMLLGYTDLIGSDISPKAIADSKKNVEWMKKNFNLKMNPTLEVQDALRLSSLHRGATIGAIVTETYLGPQRGKVDIKKVSSELQTLYSEVLKECFRILKPGRRVVMAIPAFNAGKQTIKLTVPAGFMHKDSFLYGRAGQGVFRQILVLEKR